MPNEAQTLLIRLIGHPTNNPHLIDKFIILRGLPYDWVFKKSKYVIEHEDGTREEGVGDNLLTPWDVDVDVNIPKEVRDRTEQITYLRWYPDISLATGSGPRKFNGFWDKRTAWGLRLDYTHGPAQELWIKIEEFIDRTLLRGEKMPEPVQVAIDQKTPFKTVLAKRGRTLSSIEMIEMDVPIIDLRTQIITPTSTTSMSPNVAEVLKTVITVPADPKPPTQEEKKDENLYKCQDCNKEFEKAQALRMHRTKMHPKEKVKV